MRWRLVIFDLDGTLVDSFPWFMSALPEVAAQHHFRVPDLAEQEALRNLGPRIIVAALGVARWRLPFIAAEMRRRKAAAGPMPLFPGVARMLRELDAAGVAVGLATSDTEANARRALGASAALIQYWGCGASLFGKARVLRRVLRAARTTTNQAILIGDEVRDAEAARATDTAFGAVTWGYGARAGLEAQHPVLIVDRMQDIVPALHIDA